MEVYRLSRKKYGTALSGAGAAIRGGRWNLRGTEMIYTADSRALAMAKVAVYLTLDTLPPDYMMLTIFIPDSVSVQQMQPYQLPGNWHIFPHLRDTQLVGEKFIQEEKSCLLKVPSAIVPGDYNILLNPKHKEFSKIKVVDQQDFPFNHRLF